MHLHYRLTPAASSYEVPGDGYVVVTAKGFYYFCVCVCVMNDPQWNLRKIDFPFSFNTFSYGLHYT